MVRRIKLVGFKVGLSRPTTIRTINLDSDAIGEYIQKTMEHSDFISIRRID